MNAARRPHVFSSNSRIAMSSEMNTRKLQRQILFPALSDANLLGLYLVELLFGFDDTAAQCEAGPPLRSAPRFPGSAEPHRE